ncbi:Rhodanese domain protein [Alkaliphilus metalliredigens QYMF]|uniref:Rhodanese domain protein n=1 Tax=Alkaliphilus metalliredigens (strain QYMF) TaxID=293826 RepID=A6TT55_ALKMQ|nr:rhodanese-like domain-containing protein [Alkaliphilus metalliredigens]ABR49373.1 Rhodanese domain protein [Alkaliphilus metalliredigens QYMF]
MYKWIVVILIVVMSFIFYNNNRKEEGYQKMNPVDARLQLEEDSNILLIDVRTQEEYMQKHIEGSKLIPLNVLESKIKKAVPNKEKKIILYCQTGSRSAAAANMLLNMGYKNVHDLGGINKWPYETKGSL